VVRCRRSGPTAGWIASGPRGSRRLGSEAPRALPQATAGPRRL